MGNIFEGFPKRDKFIKTLSNSYSSILLADKILLSKGAPQRMISTQSTPTKQSVWLLFRKNSDKEDGWYHFFDSNPSGYNRKA